MRSIYLLVGLIFLSACAHSIRKVSSDNTVNLELRWERGRCQEDCASFTLIARDDGTASCIGIKKVGIRGRFDADLNVDVFHNLVQNLKDKGLFQKLTLTQKFPPMKNRKPISYFTVTEAESATHFWADAGSSEVKEFEAQFALMESTIQWDLKKGKKRRLSCLRK